MISSNSLNKHTIGQIYINLKTVDSTNKKAHFLALQGCQDGTIITADRQTKGRGRRGNFWHSPEGGLYCSIILRPNITINEIKIFEKISGIAVWETVAHLVPQNPTLKIPNDILIKGRKVAGILIETRGRKDKLNHLVIGIGINCRGDLDCFPVDLKTKITTLSNESGRLITPSETLNVLIHYINKWYKIFLSNNITHISYQWDKLAQEDSSCQAFS